MAGVLGGCAHATVEQLRKRASFDLDCPEGQITLVEIDPRTTGVRGCDRKATYVETCETGSGDYGTYRTNCTWVLNAAPAERGN